MNNSYNKSRDLSQSLQRNEVIDIMVIVFQILI